MDSKILFMPNGLGDTLMSMPAVNRELEKGSSITLVTRNDNLIEFISKTAKQKYRANKLRVINRKIVDNIYINIFHDIYVLFKILRSDISCIYAPLVSNKFKNSVYFSILALLGKKIYVPSNFNNFLNLTNIKIQKFQLKNYGKHQCEYLIDFVNLFDRNFIGKPFSVNEYFFKKENQNLSVKKSKKRIAISLSCGKEEIHKIISFYQSAELINALYKNVNFELVIISTDYDREIVSNFLSYLNKNIRYELVENYNFEELITLLNTCDLGITGTTGQGHLMALIDLPLIIVCGVTNPHESCPMVSRAYILRHSLPCSPCYQTDFNQGCRSIACMQKINVHEHIPQILELLNDKSKGFDYLTKLFFRKTTNITDIKEILNSTLKKDIECYVCKSTNSYLIFEEYPIEKRFNKPVLPSLSYKQKKCRDCGLLFTFDNLDEDFIENLYTNETVEWQTTEKSYGHLLGPTRVEEFKKLARILLKVKTPPLAGKALDFGCQTGEFLSFLTSSNNIEPVGVEMSNDYASVSLKKWGRGYVHVGKLEKSTFKESTFDYVSAQEVLEHISDPRKILHIFKTILKKDGVLLISVPSSHYFYIKHHIFNIFNKKPNLVHTHIYNFTIKSLQILVEESGFTIHEIGPTGWHGKLKSIGSIMSDFLKIISNNKITFAPSVYCVAIKK
jgi:ADP-heptose:LPS heptosyltransferase/2-polyprenyl-3-methyl-5-hydroxy-6-metoxy-1,4-benzoquinol methylase